jgi:dCMP deaminase
MKTWKWDKRWLEVAKVVSSWSKDPSSKCGAIAVMDNRIIAQGYNGFPRGFRETDDLLNDREKKYERVVHSETNMIYNAVYNGQTLKGATVYNYGLPTCHECAKSLIQSGVTRVVSAYDPESETYRRWGDRCKLAAEFFAEGGVVYEMVPFSYLQT